MLNMKYFPLIALGLSAITGQFMLFTLLALLLIVLSCFGKSENSDSFNR